MSWTQQSIRKGLLGELFDFVSTAGFNSTDVNETIADLVFFLSEYREEDVPYFPDVYLFYAAHESALLNALAPGRERVPIGAHPVKQCVAKCLKDCSALADFGWAIYISLDTATVRYGLFRAADLPISVSASESLTNPDVEISPVILVRNCAAKCVELIDGTGQTIEMSMTTAPPSSDAVSTHVGRLASAFVSDVPAPDSQRFRAYTENLLSGTLRASHGSLIAVISASSELEADLRDGVILDPPLSLLEPFRMMDSKGDASSFSQLQAREALLKGMIASDGVTILGADGTMRAFRVFLRPTSTEAEEMSRSERRGGGRTRAFQLLKLRLKSCFIAAFFRSQDGHTEFAGEAK